MEIQFDQKGRISGAAIRTYLLERSRVCQVSNPERNYHCFYMLCAAPQEVDDSSFQIINFGLQNLRSVFHQMQKICVITVRSSSNKIVYEL